MILYSFFKKFSGTIRVGFFFIKYPVAIEQLCKGFNFVYTSFMDLDHDKWINLRRLPGRKREPKLKNLLKSSKTYVPFRRTQKESHQAQKNMHCHLK